MQTQEIMAFMKCPRCKKENFQNEKYEGTFISRCQSCQGAWLRDEQIVKILQERIVKFSEEEIKQTLSEKKAGIPKEEIQSKRKCPKCKKTMTTFNYGYDSGIILDRCPRNHGLWFDEKELEKIQIYQEYWESEALNMGESWQKILEQIRIHKGSKPYDDTYSPFKLLINLFYRD